MFTGKPWRMLHLDFFQCCQERKQHSDAGSLKGGKENRIAVNALFT